MEDNRSAFQYKDGQQFLFESTYGTLMFNIGSAFFLALYLYLNNAPKYIILIWLASMTLIVGIRRAHCKFVISKVLRNDAFNFHLSLFVILSFLTGLIWVSIYFLSIPYMAEAPLYVIVVVYGGMTAGSATTLGVYYPAFFAYLFSIFVPIVTYNYAFLEINHIIVGTIFVFFMLGVTTVARAQQATLRKVFFLTEQNKALLDKFEMLSITDPLTNLYNRRHFTKIIQEEYNRAKRNQQSIILVSIDIDNFKLINDNFGHPFGDKFLIYTADYLQNYLMPINGAIFRLGGDEFAALIINQTEEETMNICHEIKTNFTKTPRFDCDVRDSKHQNILDQVSLSIGVVYISHDSIINMEKIIDTADQLLYQAKNHGKNTIQYTNIR